MCIQDHKYTHTDMQTHAHTSHTNPPTRKKVIYISRLCVDQREMNKLENTEPG